MKILNLLAIVVVALSITASSILAGTVVAWHTEPHLFTPVMLAAVVVSTIASLRVIAIGSSPNSPLNAIHVLQKSLRPSSYSWITVTECGGCTMGVGQDGDPLTNAEAAKKLT